MDFIYWVNDSFRDGFEQIEKKEFQNDAINSNIELGPFIVDWSKRAHTRIRNKGAIDNFNPANFNMCDHHWILNITNRVRLITKFNDLLKV
jgi:hypothetical protein